MKRYVIVSEILVGLLALIIGIIFLYLFRFFSIRIGGEIMVYGTVILALTLLAVGIFRLVSVFSFETSSLTRKINVLTGVLTILVAVIILYFQTVAIGGSWLHFLFGSGLLSYAIGRVSFGALTKECRSALRGFISVMGITIGAFSVIVVLFQMVLVNSEPSFRSYLTYSYFFEIALILIGVDCLVSAILGMFLGEQKQSA